MSRVGDLTKYFPYPQAIQIDLISELSFHLEDGVLMYALKHNFIHDFFIGTIKLNSIVRNVHFEENVL